MAANGNGIRISLGMLAGILGLLAQFGAIVWWLSTEHAAQVALQTRMDAATARVTRESEVIKSTIDQRNNAQDQIISRLDQGGSRKLEITDERLQSVTRRVEVLERLIEEQRGRDDVTRAIAQQAYDFSRETYFLLNPGLKDKLQQFPPMTWPPNAQQQIGPRGGITVGPGGLPTVTPPSGGVPQGVPSIIQQGQQR